MAYDTAKHNNRLDSKAFTKACAETRVLRKAILAAGGSQSMANCGRRGLSNDCRIIADAIDGKSLASVHNDVALEELEKYDGICKSKEEWQAFIRKVAARDAVEGKTQGAKLLADLKGIDAFSDGSEVEQISESTARRIARIAEKILSIPEDCPQCGFHLRDSEQVLSGGGESLGLAVSRSE